MTVSPRGYDVRNGPYRQVIYTRYKLLDTNYDLVCAANAFLKQAELYEPAGDVGCRYADLKPIHYVQGHEHHSYDDDLCIREDRLMLLPPLLLLRCLSHLPTIVARPPLRPKAPAGWW